MAELTKLVISLPGIDKAVTLSLSVDDCKQACGDPDAFLTRLIKPSIAKLMAEYFEHIVKNQTGGHQ